MRHSTIISKALTTLSLTTVLATVLTSCEDKQTTTSKPISTTTQAPSAPPTPSSEPQLPPTPAIPAPVPEATVAAPAKVASVAITDDADETPFRALAGSRKALTAGDKERALKLAAIAVLHAPKSSGAFNALGRAQLQLGKRKDAIASFEKAVELNPRNSYAHNNLGLALIYDKRYDDAVDALEEAVQWEPVEGYMWNNLGMAYEHLDRLDDARDAYDKAVEMDSDNARESLARLKGVKSVVRTAKVETEIKDSDRGPVGPR